MTQRLPKTHSRWASWTADVDGGTGQAIVTKRVLWLLKNKNGLEFSYKPGGGSRSLLSWVRAWFALWKAALFGEFRQLYVVCSRSNAGFLRDLPAYLLVLIGVNVVVHSHGSDIVDLCRRRLLLRLPLFFLSRAIVIVPSIHLLQPLQAEGVRDIVCCENFFEDSTPQTAEAPVAGAQSSKPFWVLWNSNIMATKGFFTTAEAVRHARSNGADINLIAVGKCIGDEQMNFQECQAALKSLQAETWFDYRGAVSRVEATGLLKDADAVCLPSVYSSECQPLALIEAMCAGRPIVIADTKALVETAGQYPCERVGLPPTAENVAAVLTTMYEQTPDQDTLLAAAKYARQRFSPERFDDQMRLILGLNEDARTGMGVF